MNHYATPEFWEHYRALPADTKLLADKSFALVKTDLRHPSLHLKKVGDHFSARVGLFYRALGIGVEGGISWFWIGTHADYDKLVR